MQNKTKNSLFLFARVYFANPFLKFLIKIETFKNGQSCNFTVFPYYLKTTWQVKNSRQEAVLPTYVEGFLKGV